MKQLALVSGEEKKSDLILVVTLLMCRVFQSCQETGVEEDQVIAAGLIQGLH